MRETTWVLALVHNDTIKQIPAISQHFILILPKAWVKNDAFLSPEWLVHMLPMTEYLVTTATDSHQNTLPKCL